MFAGVVVVCRDVLFQEARKWYDGEVLAASKDEFFDTELITNPETSRS